MDASTSRPMPNHHELPRAPHEAERESGTGPEPHRLEGRRVRAFERAETRGHQERGEPHARTQGLDHGRRHEGRREFRGR